MVSGGDEEAQSQLISFAGLIIGAYKVNACDIMYALHGGVLNRLGESWCILLTYATTQRWYECAYLCV